MRSNFLGIKKSKVRRRKFELKFIDSINIQECLSTWGPYTKDVIHLLRGEGGLPKGDVSLSASGGGEGMKSFIKEVTSFVYDPLSNF